MSSTENKTEIKPAANLYRAVVFMGFGLLSVIIGFILTPSFEAVIAGLKAQQGASGLLDINTFLVVGEYIGAPFINAGILVIIVMLSYLLTNTVINGGTIAAAFMVYGFGFCGKTLWNVWPLFFGVLLYAKVYKKEINMVTGLGWFAAALSPIVSLFTMYIRHDGSANEVIGEQAVLNAAGVVFAVLIGLGAGFLVGIFASFLPDKHTGLTLYNAGYAAGLTGFFVFAVMKVIGLGHTNLGPFHDYGAIDNLTLIGCIAVMLVYLIVCGLLIAKKEQVRPGGIVTLKFAGSAVEQFGFGPTLVNMGVCGFGCLLYWALTTTADAHGPLYACLFTVVGFAANGISLRTMAPIMAGVYCACFVLGGVRALLAGAPFFASAIGYVGSKNMLIAAIYACGMAPVVYRHGALPGFLAGAVHSVLVPNTAVLAGWMNLYNNGFCLGLVVTFFVPVILVLLNRKNE